MKKVIRIINLIIIISLMVITFNPTFVEAVDNTTKISKTTKSKTIDTSITSDNYIEKFNPNNTGNIGTAGTISTPIIKFIKQVINPILAIVQIIGVLLCMVSVGMYGIGLLLSSNAPLAKDLNISIAGADTKVALLEYGRKLLIGSVLLLGSTTIVRFVFGIFSYTS